MTLPLPQLDTLSPPIWIWILLVLAGVVASITDIRETRIPNWLTLPLIVTGAVHAVVSGGVDGVLDAGGGMVVASALFVWAYAFHGGGAGDAKMMMGVGLWLGFDASIVVTLAVTIAGVVIAMFGVAARGSWRDVPVVLLAGGLRSIQSIRRGFAGQVLQRDPEEVDPATIRGRRRPKGWIPYAPAILVGMITGGWYIANWGTPT